MLYPALLPLMRTPRLPVVDWTDAPRRFKWVRFFRWKTKSGFCACAITFQLASTCQHSHYSSHCLGTWCVQHYYRWCAHLGCQQSTELTHPLADLNGLVRLAERRNLVSAHVPSHFNWPLQLCSSLHVPSLYKFLLRVSDNILFCI